MYKFSFEKLEVWQLSKDFVKEIYSISKKFPDNEKYGLVSQIIEHQFQLLQILLRELREHPIKTKHIFHNWRLVL